MKILVVDNITVRMPSLKKALKGYEYKLIKYNKLKKDIINDYDKIILSGGHAFNVLHKNKKYKKELEIIKSCKKPILGICLGFQLICRAYVAHVGVMKKPEKGILKIKKVRTDKILKNIPDSFYVSENHRNNVIEVSNSLLPLAISKDGIEVIKHKSLPIWGTQFHPEKFVKKNEGRKVLYNFLDKKVN